MRRLVIAVTLLVAASFAQDTLLTQNFNAIWRTNNPPLGWRIFHTGGGPMGRGDWDWTQNVAPWAAHATPYAGIRPDPLQDNTPDSLISPVISCRGYWHVTVLCSSNFTNLVPNSFIAQIRYSVDGGATFPYLAKDYASLSTGTVKESLVLDAAQGSDSVVIAWYFYGDLNNIQNWFIDDVVVTGESLPLYPLFYEDFNSNWTTQTPPLGWRIFHTGPSFNRADWHREEANTGPWGTHPSRFAAIGPILDPDAPPDSLISPTINCVGFKNIMLVCSTFFYYWSTEPYTAQLVYSTDGGATWPYVLHDYRLDHTTPAVPVIESLSMDHAAGQPNVQLAWVYDGDIQYIQWWSLDDVMVIGESVPLWDVACNRITHPPARVPPGQFQPSAIFTNEGRTIQSNVPVRCSLYTSTMNPLRGWTGTIGSLQPQIGVDTFTFTPPYNLPVGQYFIKTWAAADSDYRHWNDTLSRTFEGSLLRELSYDDGTVFDYETWPVGHCGWGVKFDADTSPVYLESLSVFLRAPADPNYRGYQLAVYLEDSVGNPGKLFYKTPVQYAAAGDTWNQIFLAGTGRQMVMPNGRFFVFYMQVGEPPECPALGRDSDRNPLATCWQYRKGVMLPDTTPGDFMIRAVVYLAEPPHGSVDLRALYVDQPLYEFVQRPFDAPMTPKGRIQNFGNQTVGPVSVACDIVGPGAVLRYTNTQTLDSLVPGQDTLVTFQDWVPTTAERCSVVLRVSPDPIPLNDEKRFAVDILKGTHTGVSPLLYHWIDSDTVGGPTYAWIDTTGFSRIGGLGDNGFINIPFEPGMHFPYYDSTFDFVLVSANGWVALGSSNPGGNMDTVPDRIPIPDVPNRCVYAWWDNLTQDPDSSSGEVFYRWFGEEPNRYMVVVFQDVNRMGTDPANGITFELIFRENGMITIQYKDVETGDLNYDNAKNSSIGIENSNGTDGLNYLYARPPMSAATHDLANRLSAGRAISFFPDRRDAAALSIVKPATYEFPHAITPQAWIQNYGTVSDSIRVFMTIGAAYSDDTLIPGLPAGESLLVSFDPWQAQLGTYVATCSVHMVDDVNPANNVVTKTIYISAWTRREDIPPQYRKRKVKSGALCYAPTTNKLYAMKGSNTVDFWQYDIATDSWDTLASMPLAPSGSKPRDGVHLTYAPDTAGGVGPGGIYAIKAGGRPDFYYYDIARDTWFAKRSMVVTYKDWPYSGRTYRAPKKGAAIEYVQGAGSKGSVYGIPGNGTNYFWRYDIAKDSWFYPHDSVYAEYNGVPYWKYIPLDVPSGAYGVRCRYGSDMSVLNGIVYVLKGSATVETWGFSHIANAWRETLDQNTLYGPRMKRVKAGGSMVAHGDHLYVLKGGNTQEFWHYDFGQKFWYPSTDIPLATFPSRRVKVKRGSAMASADSSIFALKGSNTYEFWEYNPNADSLNRFAGRLPAREGVTAEAGSLDLSQPWLEAYPNPTRTGLNISYNITSTAPTCLRVYDAAGKLVTSLWDASRTRGHYVAHWDGLTPNGKRAAAGVYFVKLESGGNRLTQKFIVQR